MGEFRRAMLPDTQSYFEGEGLKLKGKGQWRTTECKFHGGSDSMRVNLKTGGWICMSCGIKGSDALAYHMAMHEMDFIAAAKALGAWIDDGKPHATQRPKPLPAIDALRALAFEATLTAVSAGNLANGFELTEIDRTRLFRACARINTISEEFQ
jgi:hypothetical protein